MALKMELEKLVKDHFQDLQNQGHIPKGLGIDVVIDPKDDEEYERLEKKATGKIGGSLFISYVTANPYQTEARVYCKPQIMIMIVHKDKEERDELMEQVLNEMVKLKFIPERDYYLSNVSKSRTVYGAYWLFRTLRRYNFPNEL